MRFIFTSLFCLALMTGLSAQDLAGNWLMEIPTESGEVRKATLSIGDGNYTVDFGNDGEIDIRGEFTLEGDQITIWDISESENSCPVGAKGVYKFAVSDAELTMTQVSDECKGRGNPDGPMTMKRI